MSTTKQYTCNGPIKHNGKRFTTDSPIDLSDKDAAPLLKAKAITKAVSAEGNEPTDLEKVLAVLPDVVANPENLTNDGAPKVAALSEAVGFEVKAELRDSAWVAFNKVDAQ